MTNVESLSREELIAVVAQQTSRISELEVQLKWFKNQLFGRKSERRLAGDSKYVQLTLGGLLEEETPPTPNETVKEYQRRIKPDSLSELNEDEGSLQTFP